MHVRGVRSDEEAEEESLIHCTIEDIVFVRSVLMSRQ